MQMNLSRGILGTNLDQLKQPQNDSVSGTPSLLRAQARACKAIHGFALSAAAYCRRATESRGGEIISITSRGSLLTANRCGARFEIRQGRSPTPGWPARATLSGAPPHPRAQAREGGTSSVLRPIRSVSASEAVAHCRHANAHQASAR